jgi:cytochrome c oxidase cbb3-type subunit 4
MLDGWSYQDVVAFSESWGGVYFMIMFLVALAYALWPSNQAGFQQAARIPFDDDGDV